MRGPRVAVAYPVSCEDAGCIPFTPLLVRREDETTENSVAMSQDVEDLVVGEFLKRPAALNLKDPLTCDSGGSPGI